MKGKQLKEIIDKLGITQRKLAEQMEVTPQTISAILTAKDVRTSTIERIATVTNMPISYFFEKNHSEVTPPSVSGIAVRGNNNVAGNVTIGDASMSESTVLQERIKSLEALLAEKERLLEEKERLIKVLLSK